MLKGDKTYIRLLSTDDATTEYCKWMNDPEIMKYLEGRWKRYTVADIQHYISECHESETNYLFGIFDFHSNKHIGNIKIGSINQIHRYADIGLLIGEKDFWGKGYATEAIKLATFFSFQELNIHKLIAGVYRGNESSCKSFIKNDYVEVGILKDHRFIQGKYVDQYILEKLNKGN